jgi:hypothetical protein
MNLSKNFTLYEATRSSKAIQLGIDNSMKPAIHMQAEWFAKNVLQSIRDRIGKPFNVSSWYRCPALNKAVRGVYNSPHLGGMAVDFMIKGLSVKETWETVLVALKDLRIEFDQLIMERNTKTGVVWVHLSAKKSGNRNQYFKLDVE